MIPDLGKYATEVLAAYGVSIALLVLIVAVSIRRGRKVHAQLAAVEARLKPTHRGTSTQGHSSGAQSK